MLDLTVIILTYNEELHIRRCLENVCPIAKEVYVIDCFSTDQTQEICAEFKNVRVVEHEWPGNQATQFNWAMDHLEINTDWILRLDADEYLLPELAEEITQKVPTLPQDVTGIELKRRHIFMGKWVKRGIYPVVLMRMFRKGEARYDERLMDEHLSLRNGRSITLHNDFCDHSLISISDYCRKHIVYAQREACEVLNELYQLKDAPQEATHLGHQASAKHKTKSGYNKLPLFLRSFAYFLYRYILRGGFLDGKEGFLFAFIQGWWYRTLVDANILACKKACGNDKERIKEYIKKEWGIEVN
ncbi:MAG: glycosyltransferase family 2 protein [Paludibacteraceae bacterium]|nr:glycosyltransferase family 2 protein [Paludibacteraceae bacterium]